ncbi:DUF302 domain-containing protein [Paraburkholderia bryophila]|uniref:Uncharacterized protein (DUF302 family) n=1 Tax=Paraburkholderia bryophila TaxID=420952 RepID=A0A7Z0B968_9BURK|nr:uncharacterized protein (DUF302 family) [Paraburkholderia bryophila]
MIKQIQVSQVTISTTRPFDDVIHAFESQVGSLEETDWQQVVSDSSDKGAFEQRINESLGSSGFTRFLTVDHGKWMALQGHPSKFVMYTIGNPFIAITMLRHDVEAGLDVPVRIAIYEHHSGDTRFTYNIPSSLLSGINNPSLHEAALKLDSKLMALAESVTGSIA